MDKRCCNRLTVLGPTPELGRFLKSKWDRRLHARHVEWMENSPSRFVCLFETGEPPLEHLRKQSEWWRSLMFLLDYEVESERKKGLAKANAGRLEHWETTY